MLFADFVVRLWERRLGFFKKALTSKTFMKKEQLQTYGITKNSKTKTAVEHRRFVMWSIDLVCGKRAIYETPVGGLFLGDPQKRAVVKYFPQGDTLTITM